MRYFKKKTKEEKDLEQFLNSQFRTTKELSEQRRIRAIATIAILLFVTVASIVGYYVSKDSSDLDKHGEQTVAVIKDIQRNTYRMNDMDGTRVNNYLIQYEFSFKDESIVGLETIEKSEYSNYFDGEIMINDTIKIEFDKNKPSNSRILSK